MTRDSARRESNAGVSAALQWSLLYGQSMIHAIRLSARTASLFDRLIERVSRGDVTPASLPDLLEQSTRSHGDRYGSSISGLHEGFIRRLVDLSLERAQTPSACDLPPVADFVEQVTRLSFALLNDLTNVRTTYQEDYLRDALRIGAAARGQVVTLVAEAGAVASALLLVASGTSQPGTVRCVATDVRRADGVGPAFVPAIGMTPDVLEMQPGKEASVTISLRLDDSLYHPNAMYVGELHVVRGSEACMSVPLHITAIPTRQ